MRTQHSPARVADAGVIVFGRPKGSKVPRAGLFIGNRLNGLAEAARRQGLHAVRLSAENAQCWRDQLGRGDVAQNGSLRLQAIQPALLRELQALAQPRNGQKRLAGTNGTPPTQPKNGPSPSKPTGSSPPPDDLGANLLGAYRVLDKAGPWIETLQSAMPEALAAAAKGTEWSLLDDELTLDEEAYCGGDGWVFNGWRSTFPARRRRQRVGSVLLVTDIGRPGRPAHAIGPPCVLVAWSSAAHDCARAIDAAVGFWPPRTDKTRLLADCLVQWVGEIPGNGPATGVPLAEGAWFFLVPLSAVTGLPKLRDLIAQPALALLAGSTPDEVFAKVPEVLRFSQRKGELVPRR